MSPSGDRTRQNEQIQKRLPARVSIFIRQSNKHAERVRHRRKGLEGPVTLSLRLALAKCHGPAIERAYIIACEDARAVSYIRYRLRELMDDLDGTMLLVD